MSLHLSQALPSIQFFDLAEEESVLRVRFYALSCHTWGYSSVPDRVLSRQRPWVLWLALGVIMCGSQTNTPSSILRGSYGAFHPKLKTNTHSQFAFLAFYFLLIY